MKSAILQRHGTRISVLLGFHLVWVYVLWWSVAVHGLGTSRDSVEYLFTSLSVTRGEGFVSFLGEPYVLWPPLYPLLLSLVQTAAGIDPLQAALVLQLITFMWIAILTAWLFSRLFQRNFALAFIGNALVGTGVALTWLFQAVGSDYLFIALTLSLVYLCDVYINKNRLGTVWLIALVSALAMLQRYIGITVLFTGVWIVFRYSRTPVWEKLKRCSLLGFSVIPIGIWVSSLPVEAIVRDDPSSLFENIHWFTFSILSWFFPEAGLYGHPIRLQFGMWCLWLGVLAGGLVVWKFRRKPQDGSSIESSLYLFGVIYTILLLAIASLSSFNSLDSRFVSPVYVPLVVLSLKTMETILSFEFGKVRFMQTAFRAVAYVLLLVVLSLSGFRSVTAVNLHRQTGWGYTSVDWGNNQVIAYWLEHKPGGEYLAFSNYPAGVAVHTWHAVLSSPRRTAHPNVGEAVIPLDAYLPSLFEPGKDSYVIWMEPNEYTHVYTVDDLRGIVNVETVYESVDGGIYRVLPLK